MNRRWDDGLRDRERVQQADPPLSSHAQAPNAESLDSVYAHRFGPGPEVARDDVWAEIVRYLQRFIAEDARVLDVAAGGGEFIRHVRARERWATDLRDVGRALPSDVRFVRADGLALRSAVPNAYFDAVFMSNYLEHLPSPGAVIEQLTAVFHVLKPGGRVIILQPNVRLVGGRYWDFIDHRVALTERSLDEAGAAAGLRRVQVITRFLPYTTKSRLPQHPALVRLYLRCRPAWLLLGKQTLYIAERSAR